jgi:hypothetical protein
MRQLILRSTRLRLLSDPKPVFSRFAGPRSSCIAAPVGVFDDDQDQPGQVISTREHRVFEPVPTYPEGPRWAVNSRTNRLQWSLCSNDATGSTGHARAQETWCDVAGELYAGRGTTGVVNVSELKTEDMAPTPPLDKNALRQHPQGPHHHIRQSPHLQAVRA